MTARAILLGLLAILPALAMAAGGERPNIVLIFSDDQGWGDLSAYGSQIPTPQIDSIARDGIRFTDFYVSAPVCTPSRFSLLTGMLPHRSHDRLDDGALMPTQAQDADRGIRPDERTLAEMLKPLGYRTAAIGKWHLGHGDPKFLPTRHGFDQFYGFTPGCVDFFTLRYGRDRCWYRGEELVDDTGYATDLLTDEAVKFIEEAGDEPFFLYLPYNAPHYAKSWDEAAQASTNTLQAKPEDRAAMDWIADERRREYAGMVKALDDGVGRVLAALEKEGIAEETWVIFISDNGGDLDYGASNGLLAGDKNTLWEGGIRVPCVMRLPGRIAPGTVSAQPGSALDSVPTVAGLVGAELAGMVDGVDLRPALFDGKPVDRELFWDYKGNAAMRRGDWKYLRIKGEERLHNLANDARELQNRAAAEPERLAALKAAHAAVAEGLGLKDKN